MQGHTVRASIFLSVTAPVDCGMRHRRAAMATDRAKFGGWGGLAGRVIEPVLPAERAGKEEVVHAGTISVVRDFFFFFFSLALSDRNFHVRQRSAPIIHGGQAAVCTSMVKTVRGGVQQARTGSTWLGRPQ